MKNVLFFFVCCVATSSCAVNPDADKALREERRRADSIAAADRGVQRLPADSGQHAMPTVPTVRNASDMPVVNPADSTQIEPK